MSTASRPAAALALAVIALGIAAPAVSAPTEEDGWSGEKLFASRCGMCHRAGGMGTGILSRRPNAGSGLLEERRDLNADFIKAVARAGTGNMPRVARGEVSDAQLSRIAAYLVKDQR